ncbi:peptidoglycan-binding domain-containing protein [Nocardiopsis tropica]|nr:peptidoglycan-binding domain-containing protein [Nocardiopsis tropica]
MPPEPATAPPRQVPRLLPAGAGRDRTADGVDDNTPRGSTGPHAQTESDMVGLKLNDTGERVKYLQELLTFAGFPPGTIDGVYGTRTADAVLGCRRSEGSNATSGNSITGAAAKQILTAFVRRVPR